MKILCFVLLSALVPAIQAQVPAVRENVTIEEKAYNQFAIELLVETTGLLDMKHNMMLSPFSVWSVMALLAEGSQGITRSQMNNTMHLDMGSKSLGQRYHELERLLKTGTDAAVEFDMANALVTDKNRPISQSYENLLVNMYGANIVPVSFHEVQKATKEINNWVSNITRHRITQIVNEGDLQKPQLIVANAIYFKGAWKELFNESDTIDLDFLDEAGKVIAKVPTMKKTAQFVFGFVPEVESHMLVLPYQGDQFSMVIAVPQKKVPLIHMLERFKLVTLGEVLRQLEQMQGDGTEEVQVQLPRFTIRSDFVLNSVLNSMGVTDAFSERANFRLISYQNLYVSKLIHKAEIEVNEEGTVASAATGAVFAEKMMPSVFKANRPFAYFIIENKHKSILFTGRVTNPLSG